MKYRIKIEERNNGDKLYCPQVKSGGLFSFWRNLHYDTIFNCVTTYKVISESWRSIDKAKEVIELHKKQVEEEQREKVKTIKYIKL